MTIFVNVAAEENMKAPHTNLPQPLQAVPDSLIITMTDSIVLTVIWITGIITIRVLHAKAPADNKYTD